MSKKTIISITNTGVQAVVYSKNRAQIKVFKHYTVPFESEVIINGVIIDEDELLSKLNDLKAKDSKLLKNVELLVDSNEIMVKKIESPKLNKQQYSYLAENYFSTKTGEDKDFVCGYSVLKSDASQAEILVGAAVKELISRFVSIFERANSNIVKIHIGIESIIKYLSASFSSTDGGVVFNIVDGNTMLSLIFDKGNFVFSTRSRIIADTQSEYSDYILRELSGLTQFALSQNMSNISKSYYAGIPKEIIENVNAVSADISVLPFKFDRGIVNSKNESSEAFGITYFAMMADKREIDLYEDYKRKSGTSTQQHKDKKLKTYIIFHAAVIALIAVAYIGVLLLDMKAVNDNKSAQEYLTRSDVVSSVNTVDKLKGDMENYTQRIGDIQSTIDKNNSIPKITPDIVRHVLGSVNGDMKITSMKCDSVQSYIQIEVQAKEINQIAPFLAKVQDNKAFVYSEYKGFAASDGKYRFSVTMYMTEKKEEEAQ